MSKIMMLQKIFENSFFRSKRYILSSALLSFLIFYSGQIACCVEKISQFGIEWAFDKAYPTGQFANGDYWVVGPLKIICITPESTVIDGRTINGSMINPSLISGAVQGYDSAMYAAYGPYFDARLNAGRPYQKELSPDNPLVIQPGSSLVSSVSMTNVGNCPQLKTVAILTVLSEPAPECSFRPPYCGTDKTIQFRKNRLDFSVLKSLKPVPSIPAITDVERYFERPWIDHVPGWLGRYHHPKENMPDYGREIAKNVGVGALMLNLDFFPEQKEKLLIRYVQLGIDLYGIVKAGGMNNWHADGGHASGRKFPILFAGILLNDEEMKSVGRIGVHAYGSSDKDDIHFGEDGQTFYVNKDDIYNTPYSRKDYHGFVFYGHGNGSKKRDYLEYKDYHKGLPEWGIVHTNNRDLDGFDWDASYRRCCTANSWAGFILAAHIMEMKELWNHNALFDYMDRYMQVEFQLGSRGKYIRQWDRFSEDMWDFYRSDYGSVWTISPKLEVSAENGVIKINSDRKIFKLGEQVTLKAVADEGYAFVGWSGDLAGKENPRKVIMHADRKITAEFEIQK